MKNIFTIVFGFWLVCCSAVWSWGAGSNAVEIVDGFHGVEKMQRVESREPGGEFVNRFAVPTREQAIAKVTKLREAKEMVTVERFLGGDIRFIRITFFDDSLKDFETARSFLQDLLNSTIISPSHHEGPFLNILWSEGSNDSIKALIFYANGSVGRIESDGWHLFLEDAEGTYWWHRLEISSAPAAADARVAEAGRAVKGTLGEPSPLAQWSFAQKDGDFVQDASGHGYDAQIHGHPRLVPRWGQSQALEFDGSGDNAFWRGGPQDCGLSIGKRLTQGFTELSLEVWLRKTPAGWMPVVYRDLWDSSSGFGLYAEWKSGKVVFGHYDSAGHNQAQSETTVQDGRWHHVVGTMQAVAPRAGGDERPGQSYLYRIYVDGQLDAEQTGTWAVEETPPEGGILTIAYPNSSGAEQPYQGALDGIAIFDVALTPAQVKARFEAGRK
jgi:hypothetical protein